MQVTLRLRVVHFRFCLLVRLRVRRCWNMPAGSRVLRLLLRGCDGRLIAIVRVGRQCCGRKDWCVDQRKTIGSGITTPTTLVMLRLLHLPNSFSVIFRIIELSLYLTATRSFQKERLRASQFDSLSVPGDWCWISISASAFVIRLHSSYPARFRRNIASRRSCFGLSTANMTIRCKDRWLSLCQPRS